MCTVLSVAPPIYWRSSTLVVRSQLLLEEKRDLSEIKNMDLSYFANELSIDWKNNNNFLPIPWVEECFKGSAGDSKVSVESAGNCNSDEFWRTRALVYIPDEIPFTSSFKANNSTRVLLWSERSAQNCTSRVIRSPALETYRLVLRKFWIPGISRLWPSIYLSIHPRREGIIEPLLESPGGFGNKTRGLPLERSQCGQYKSARSVPIALPSVEGVRCGLPLSRCR